MSKTEYLLQIKMLLIIALFFHSTLSPAQQTELIPEPVVKLLKAYPESIVKYHDNKLYFKDGTILPYDDCENDKSPIALLDHPSIKDQFKYNYIKGGIPPNHDPGRIRNEALFMKMYGNTQAEVSKNLTEITWCPKTIGQRLKVTRVNGADKALIRVSEELDKHPELAIYVRNCGGTFNWRYISGTKRLSAHSFGIGIDLNVKYSNYWQWDGKSKSESAPVSYRNQLPLSLITIFENNGFIWGGRWYHYDTMHFEYRPELLL